MISYIAYHTFIMASSGADILGKTTRGATFLMMGQLFSKMVTFVLNNILVRFLSPRIFGITAFLEFIVGTVLFFSREAIRLSTQRISDEHDNEKEDHEANPLQVCVNFSHVPLWIGAPLSVALLGWQYRNINEYFVTLPFFQLSVFSIWLSIILELLSEPFFIVNQYLLNYGTRSKFESLAVTSNCLVNFIVIYAYERGWILTSYMDHSERFREGIAILAFALGKLAYSTTLLICYYYDYLMNLKSVRPFNLRLTKIKTSSDEKFSFYFKNDILEHFKKVYFQLCFKHLLTEGDKLIINTFCTVEEQGIYSLLSNYGSLITRLLFAPIEESLRLFLARLLSKKSSKNLLLSMEVLVNLTKFYLYLSLMIIIFGPNNSSFLLQFLIGSKWSTNTVLHTIRVYCVYIPFLSFNGIFEAFFSSVATGDQILRHSYFMMVCSFIFLINSYIFIQYLGLSINGLIISNIINMSLRIAYSFTFIVKFYRQLHTESSIFINFTNFKMILSMATVISLVNWQFIGYVSSFNEFFTSATLAVLLLSVILAKERTILMELILKKPPADMKIG